MSEKNHEENRDTPVTESGERRNAMVPPPDLVEKPLKLKGNEAHAYHKPEEQYHEPAKKQVSTSPDIVPAVIPEEPFPKALGDVYALAADAQTTIQNSTQIIKEMKELSKEPTPEGELLKPFGGTINAFAARVLSEIFAIFSPQSKDNDTPLPEAPTTSTLTKLFAIPDEKNRKVILDALEGIPVPPESTLQELRKILESELEYGEGSQRKAEQLYEALRVINNLETEAQERRPTPPAPFSHIQSLANEAFLRTELTTVDKEDITRLVNENLWGLPVSSQQRLTEFAEHTYLLNDFQDVLKRLNALEAMHPDLKDTLKAIASETAENLGIKHQYSRYLKEQSTMERTADPDSWQPER